MLTIKWVPVLEWVFILAACIGTFLIFATVVVNLYVMRRHLDRMDQAIFGDKYFLYNDFYFRSHRVIFHAFACGCRPCARRTKVPLDKLDALDPQLKKPFLVVFWLFTVGSSLFFFSVLLSYFLKNYT